MEVTTKHQLIEFDLLNKYVIFFNLEDNGEVNPNDPMRISVNQEVLDKFLNSVGIFWHNEKDMLEVFVYFNTGEYLCQRKKLKYNFTTKVNYWETYNFKGANHEQCQFLIDAIEALKIVNADFKSYEVLRAVEKIEQQNLFFYKRYMKKKRQRNILLSESDWRVLPDIEEKYDGEKSMWIRWRKELRDNIIQSPEEFDSGLEFAKYVYQIKFPIDPVVYKRNYPNSEVEYLSTEDQWVKHDSEASVDFLNNRIEQILEHNKEYVNQYQEVKQSVYDIIKSMDVHESHPDFDITKFVIKEQ